MGNLYLNKKASLPAIQFGGHVWRKKAAVENEKGNRGDTTLNTLNFQNICR